MSADFEVNQYWTARGRSYIREAFPNAYHRLQEEFLVNVLRAAHVPFGSILELGCGFGRITRRLAEAFPDARIVATDLSPEQLNHARRYCEPHRNVEFHRFDFYSGEPLPVPECDLALAIEVFLHHPEDALRNLLARLVPAAKLIANIDWSEHWPWPRPEHVWVHDYSSIYADLGLQSIALPIPERVDQLQQKLFVAGRDLPSNHPPCRRPRHPRRRSRNGI
jgi:SAM-dependent methyltransferase